MIEALAAAYLVVAFLFWGLLQFIVLFQPRPLRMWTLIVMALGWPLSLWAIIRQMRNA